MSFVPLLIAVSQSDGLVNLLLFLSSDLFLGKDLPFLHGSTYVCSVHRVERDLRARDVHERPSEQHCLYVCCDTPVSEVSWLSVGRPMVCDAK
jgi:hypothetical protein